METLSQQPNSLHPDVSAKQAAFDRAVSRIEAERAAAKARPDRPDLRGRVVLTPVSVLRRLSARDQGGVEPKKGGAKSGSQVGDKARNQAETEPETKPEPIPETRHKLEVVNSPRSVQERPMSRLDELNRILRKLQSDSPAWKPAP